MKTPEDWEEYRRSTYEQHGWSERRARDRSVKTLDDLPQIVWRKSGELIGNAEDYIALVKQTYNQEIVVDNEQLHAISREK
ncbi:hypothetical protein HK101_005671 [Irineochytrium annulatum]|nr:hypothetical protein HK101_005671 [Irineochytrium annulatum]